MKHPSSRPLLQWTFHRAGRYIVCQVSQTGEMFRLSLQPLCTDTAPQVAAFATGVQALQRHAEIARALRAAGWVVAAYTAIDVAGSQSAAA